MIRHQERINRHWLAHTINIYRDSQGNDSQVLRYAIPGKRLRDFEKEPLHDEWQETADRPGVQV